MTDWYYEDSGQSRGPVAEGDLRTMLADGLLPPQTRIWHESFGQAWRPATQTNLATQVARGTPPPLDQSGRATIPAPPPLVRTSHSRGLAAITPYKPRYAMLAAAVPVIVMGIEMIAVAAGVSANDPALDTGGTLWMLTLTIVFVYKDTKAIFAAGLNPQNRTMMPFILLTHVGYFLRRRAIAGLSLKPLWLWLGAVLIYAIWLGVLYG